MTIWPRGANNRADAPLIGFGRSTPTPNDVLTPYTEEERQALLPAGEEYNDWNDPQPYQTAWWKFVAEEDGWVRFDAHRSYTDHAPYDGFEGPETQMSIYIQGPPYPEDWLRDKNLYCLHTVTSSVPINAMPVYGETWSTNGLSYPYKNTSELVVKVVAGWTYWIQLGMEELYHLWYDTPEVSTTYVLSVRPVQARPYEIVVPAVGPFYNSPRNQWQTNTPIIVGGDDALRRDSSGYIEFPWAETSSTESRYGGWVQGLAGHPDWPPPANARIPSYGGQKLGVQMAMRYYAQRTDTQYYTASAGIEGNSGGDFDFYFSTTHYPDLQYEMRWDPSAPAQSSNREDYGEDGAWVAARYPVTEGIVQAVHLTPSEEFLADGEYRTVIDKSSESNSVEMWWEWIGHWDIRPPFANIQYMYDPVLRGELGTKGEPVPPDKIDFALYWGGGYSLTDGFEYAQEGVGLRIVWMEWVARWIVFEEMPLRGEPLGTRAEFGDA